MLMEQHEFRFFRKMQARSAEPPKLNTPKGMEFRIQPNFSGKMDASKVKQNLPPAHHVRHQQLS